MTTLLTKWAGTLATTVCLTFTAAAAHAMCVDAGQFKRATARAGLSIRYAAMVEVRDAPAPAYVAINRDGAWVAYLVYRDAVACVIAAGRAWTEQGEIPPADLRPTPERDPGPSG